MAESVKKEIISVSHLWMERYNKADFHGMMEYFTEDCMVFPPNADPAVGKKDVMLGIIGYHSAGGTHGAYVDGHCGLMFEILGDDWADAINYVDITNSAGEIFSHLKHWVLFKKVNGKWLVHRAAYGPRTKPAQPNLASEA